MRIYKIDEEHIIVCDAKDTRTGFKHTAILLKNGSEVSSTKICYINRTWERYTFESVISNVLSKSKLYNDDERRELLEKFNPYK